MDNRTQRLINLNSKIDNEESKFKEKQHKLGKLTARERLNILFDENSFNELNKFSIKNEGNLDEIIGNSVVIGYGTINDRLVYAYAQDYTVSSGGLGVKEAQLIVKIQEMALKMGAPIVGLLDSAGGKLKEGLDAINAYGKVLNKSNILSGVVPQIAVVMGLSGGSSSLIAGLSDFVFMVDKTSHMFLNSPNIIKGDENLEIDLETLAGAKYNNEISGEAQFIFSTEEETLKEVRNLLSYLPDNNLEEAMDYEVSDDINRVNELVIDKNLDMKEIIKTIADRNEYIEISKDFAKNVVTALIKINGQTIGVIGNQEIYKEGKLDIDASNKISRFINLCDLFNISILTLVNTDGFVESVEEENRGNIRHASKIISSYSHATVAKVTVIIKKAYGLGYLAMGSKNLGVDHVIALPDSEIAVTNPKTCSNILYKEEIKESKDPKTKRLELEKDYIYNVANAFEASEKGYVDDIIMPSLLRPNLVLAFDMLQTKRENRPAKKNSNFPI